MRTFKSKGFARFARKERISDVQLAKAIADAESGLIDADLGGGVIKQRIARPHEGKSGGYRSIVLFKAGDRAFFVHGFAKNDQANIERDELDGFKRLAPVLLGATNAQIEMLLRTGKFTEIEP
ncbi:type II toxin-antitoxin system RelE/ParE family toxin [Asticcacaulis sp.]|uniref:type II toxin-antitoxin system RelE/ParE family toxin n=1 Tax=Asticcacaulis sp. TaxID=1872648 RepID=UPI00262FD045|nr:type II toxin-antitoxin system RelE/ParE family toxin [Asticcacaulis sp.]